MIHFPRLSGVQGHPGTGKTHSIANLISCFPAEGKKILLTGKADRALGALKDRLPEKIRPPRAEIIRDYPRLSEIIRDHGGGEGSKAPSPAGVIFQIINSEFQKREIRNIIKPVLQRSKNWRKKTGG